jgi:hypothetical protein
MMRAMATATLTARAPARRVDADVRVLFVLAAVILWVYLPLGVLTGGSLYGSDFVSLHVRRLDFARRELFGPSHHLPAWYPREFLGTPFWSNVQNFPLIPTRFPLLLVDPWTAYAIGVNVAALLAAWFTYLFARRLGLGRVGAAVAGWTFACGGFFASRVMAGHLPLLEAYPALPLLLWLVERYVASDSRRSLRLNLFALGGATAAIMLAGHPQLPLYALGTALLYLPVRARAHGGPRLAVPGAAAMAAGVASASFVLFPMVLLVGRSTRALPLARANNDFAFPPWRLKAMLLPWADGWPSIVARQTPQVPFAGANELIFWDTVCYVGWLPVVAAAALAAAIVIRRRRPAGPWLFIALAGALALLLALPVPGQTAGGTSWTLLRSSARQLYVTTFALSMAAGVAINRLLGIRASLRTRGARAAAAATAAVLVVAHVIDLRTHAKAFITTVTAPLEEDVSPALAQALGNGRAAIDADLVHPLNRRVDDVGVFDSILLARPYQALLALSGLPPDTNTQLLSGPDLSTHALRWSAVTVVMTTRTRADLPVMAQGNWLNLYTVPAPLPRAGFVPLAGVRYADVGAVLDELRAGASPIPSRMFLSNGPAVAPTANVPSGEPERVSPGPRTVTYRRSSTDRIDVELRAEEDGYLRIVEAFDPGWTATVDGIPAEVLPADSFLTAVPVASGTHVVRLQYSTPGWGAGLALSAAGLLTLIAIAWSAPRLARLPSAVQPA